eukprot:scaffold110230_cov66-Phaeocystis_antarctica.AAC.6
MACLTHKARLWRAGRTKLALWRAPCLAKRVGEAGFAGSTAPGFSLYQHLDGLRVVLVHGQLQWRPLTHILRLKRRIRLHQRLDGLYVTPERGHVQRRHLTGGLRLERRIRLEQHLEGLRVTLLRGHVQRRHFTVGLCLKRRTRLHQCNDYLRVALNRGQVQCCPVIFCLRLE